MKLEQALSESQELLSEGYRKYKFAYKGTRPEYKIHDPNPWVLALDDDYKYDENGRSILGLNLNYYDGDKEALIKKINQVDNDAGFRGFDFLTAVKERFAQDKEAHEMLSAEDRKKRYKVFKKNFSQLLKYIRRYKYLDPSEVSATRKKLAKKIKKENEKLAREIEDMKIDDKTKYSKIHKQNKKIAKKIKDKHPNIAKKLIGVYAAGGINNLKRA